MRRGVWILAGVVAGALSVALCSRGAPRTFTPIRLDVALNVLDDGNVDVEERSEVSFTSPTTTFRRRAPVWHHDGVSVLSGAMDGREFPPGTGPGQLETGTGPSLDATWHLPLPVSGAHVFVLKYRAAHAVETSGIRGTLAWRVLEGRHGYESAQTCVTVTIPGSAVILDNPGFEEPATTTTERRGGHDALCAVAAHGDSLTRRVTFTIDTMTAEEPAWQYHRRRARDLMPAFVSGGIFILVVAAGIIVMLRLKYPPFRVRPDTPTQLTIPPAVEAALSKGHYTRDHASVLAAAGLVDPERQEVVRDLRRAAIVTAAVGAATWIVAAMVFDYLGPWPLSIPISIVASAAWFWMAAGRMSILSQNGEAVRARVLYSARVRDDGPTSA
jgi:hypothetical protein